MTWNKAEIADEIGTNITTLDRFLSTLDYPDPPDGTHYTELDKHRLVNLWETTGAAEQMAMEGRLQPNYQDHMDSQAWDLCRREALARAEYRCQICNASKPLDGHHRDYKRIGTPEEIRDTIALCRTCHDLVTQAKRSKTDLIRLLQARR